MSIIENAKKDLKKKLPLPVNSFMREIYIVKKELSRQRGELKELRTENRKILAELKTVEQEKINAILQQSIACRRKAEESIWANVFNNATVNNNSW